VGSMRCGAVKTAVEQVPSEVFVMSPSHALPPSWQSLSIPFQDTETAIARMDLDWKVALAMIIVIVLAGGGASLLQTLTSDKLKFLVGVCGALTAALTTINGLVYPLSAKEMWGRVDSATSEVRKAYKYMAMFELPTSGEDKLAKLKKVDQFLDNAEIILTTGRTPPGAPDERASLPDVLRAAYAQGARPEWFSSFPRQPGYLYFIGTGVSASVDGAREDAIRLAKQEAQRAILDQLSPSEDSSKIAALVGSSGGIADTDYRSTKDHDRTVYEYSVLYVIKRRDIEFYLAASGADREGAFASMQKQTDYFGQRWDATAAALDIARTELPPEEYNALVEGRNARREKLYDRAVQLLAPAAKVGNPAWYLAWYNLGLSYWNLHQYPQAAKAFLEAIALEPMLKVRDPSVYNSFGQFLVERGKYVEGEKLLQRALQLNPQITGAQYALKVAQQRVGSDPVMSAETVK
jgi:tetratricopeptide (TPR) repeat protein